MKTVPEILKVLGRKAIMEAVGVSTQAITNAKSKDIFPASWYDPIATLAESSGKTLPRDAFAWVAAE